MADPCNACETERIGCPCDGSMDAGCFLCTPDKHKRPPCPSTCPNFDKVTTSKVRSMAATGQVRMSGHALASVAAAVSAGRERSDEERAYDEIVRSVVTRDAHRQMPAPEDVLKHGGQRLYMVTTIASSARYGGTRTVVVCSSFERAQKIVENNEGDLFECSYELAVIEATVDGWLYGGLIHEQYWYVWKDGTGDGAYVPIEIPKAYVDQINIGGIG